MWWWPISPNEIYFLTFSLALFRESFFFLFVNSCNILKKIMSLEKRRTIARKQLKIITQADKASQCDIKSKWIKLTFEQQGLPHTNMCSKAVRLTYSMHGICRVYLLITCLLLLVQLFQLFHRYSGRQQEQKSWRYGIFVPKKKYCVE